MSKRKRAETLAIEDIKPGGDLILTVGDPPATRLLVSSAWLSTASSVFQAMLEGRFSESQTSRSTELPQELCLPDDSASGIRDLCALVHHNMDIVRSQRWNTSRLLHLAVAVDKYGAVNALQLQTQALIVHYLDRTRPSTEAEDAGDVITAAYLLQDCRAFEKMTKRLVMRHKGSFSEIFTAENRRHLPYDVLFALEEMRTLYRTEFMRLLFKSENTFVEGDRCDRCYVAYLARILEISHWPPEPEELSIEGMIVRLSNAYRAQPMKCSCAAQGVSVDNVSLTGLAHDLEWLFDGLCLWCLKDGASKPRCRDHFHGACYDMCTPLRAEAEWMT